VRRAVPIVGTPAQQGGDACAPTLVTRRATANAPVDSPTVTADETSAETRPAYPPPRHAMRLLSLESEQDENGDIRGWLPVSPAIVGPDGMPRIAAVAMLVDALGGLRSISASAPEWAFTADLSIHLLPGGAMERLQADLHVRRRGRRTLVVEADLLADGVRPVGSALLTFAVVPRPQHLVDIQIDMQPGRRPMSNLESDEPPTVDYIDELDLEVVEPGVVVCRLRPEVENTVGALHGAVHTALIDEASTSLGRRLLGGDVVTTDVHLAFLELGRTGPMRASANLVGNAAFDRLSVTVEITDGNGDLCSYATAEVTRA
jgi:acyl-coenzyme A thioesterase PaaI-like protein